MEMKKEMVLELMTHNLKIIDNSIYLDELKLKGVQAYNLKKAQGDLAELSLTLYIKDDFSLNP